MDGADGEAPHRVGLVLGGGGVSGMAFHAGVLAALQHDLGWDPNRADVVVGTSAGSVIAALVRSGTSTEDLAAWGSGARPTGAGAKVRRRMDRVTASRWGFEPRIGWQRPTAQHVRSVLRSRRPAGALSLLPHGWLTAGTAWEEIAQHVPGWPSRELWIVAVAIDNGARQVFGLDLYPPVGTAVAASCAVPGLLRPVRVGGRLYIDGGAHSPTNADLLAAHPVPVDQVLIVSAMTGSAGFRLGQPLRRVAARLLQAEVAALEAKGITVDIIEPDRETIAAMSLNPLSGNQRREVVRAAFLATGSQLSASLRRGLRGGDGPTNGQIEPLTSSTKDRTF